MRKIILSLCISIAVLSCDRNESSGVTSSVEKPSTKTNQLSDSTKVGLLKRKPVIVGFSESIKRLNSGESLWVIHRNKEWIRVQLIMQDNSDLVCYFYPDYNKYPSNNIPIWSSDSYKRPHEGFVNPYVTLQDDGDFIMYANRNGQNTVVWRLFSHWKGGLTEYRDFRLEITEGRDPHVSLHLYRNGKYYRTVFERILDVYAYIPHPPFDRWK